MIARVFKQKKLRSQFVLVNLCAILPIILLLSVIMLISFYRQLHESAVEAMLDKSYSAQLYAMRYFSANTEVDSTTYLHKIAPYFASHMADAAGVDVEIHSHAGLLASSTQRQMVPFVSGDVQSAFTDKSYMFVAQKGGVVLSFSSPIYGADGQTVGVIRFLYPMASQYRQLWQMTAILGGLTVAGLLLIMVVGFLFARRVTTPLYLLRDTVNLMKEGQLQQRIPPMDNAEMDELGSAFNLMCERLNEYIDVLGSQQRQLRQLFNNTTHQLKTPLTSIIGYSQMIQLNSDNDQVCEDAFIIEEAGETLLRSIEAMLEESRSQTQWHPLQPQTFSLHDMVSESINLLKPRLLKYKITVENLVKKNQMLYADRTLAQEVVLAVLDNAVLHSGCQEIRFWCSEGENGALRLHIWDNGTGISPDDAPYIFKSFYRSPGLTTAGNGLGLSICDSFMRRMSGAIWLQPDVEMGAEFVLEFPPQQH